jgi:hypothetical protein
MMNAARSVARALVPAGLAVVAGLAPAGPAPATAQMPGVPGVLGIEGRVGTAVGSYEPTLAGWQWVPGGAVGVAVSWGPSDALAGYLAYSAISFGCEDAFCRGQDVTFQSRGVSLGLRAEAPVAARPWLKAGLLFHDLEQRWLAAAPPTSATAQGRLGFEAAAGATLGVAHRIDLVPGVHLGYLPTRAADGETDRAVFLALDLGVRFRP